MRCPVTEVLVDEVDNSVADERFSDAVVGAVTPQFLAAVGVDGLEVLALGSVPADGTVDGVVVDDRVVDGVVASVSVPAEGSAPQFFSGRAVDGAEVVVAVDDVDVGVVDGGDVSRPLADANERRQFVAFVGPESE